MPDKVKNVGKVVRAICLMDHPCPNTKDALSTQIIIPQKQVGSVTVKEMVLKFYPKLDSIVSFELWTEFFSLARFFIVLCKGVSGA